MKTQKKNAIGSKTQVTLAYSLAICSSLMMTRCTQNTPSEFLLQQQQQTFVGQTKIQVNTSVDLLWVVDNSASMDTEQEKLRNGAAAFAAKYLQPNWDIRVAVIPTDLYLANSEFSSYLTRSISTASQANEGALYINTPTSAPTPTGLTYGRAFVRPSSTTYPGTNYTGNNGGMVGSGYMAYNSPNYSFPNGIRLVDMVPAYANHYGRLDPALKNHDGPIAALCTELSNYFLLGQTHCNYRESNSSLLTAAACLAGGSTSTMDCVNTLENDTIHSGNPVISTLGNTNINSMTSAFMENVTTGTAGSGSERGMQSVLELLADNEYTGSPTKFFRAGSTRAIVFVSDEEDQTMKPTPIASQSATYNPYTHYTCDSNMLNNTYNNSGVTGLNTSVCCAGTGCQYGSEMTNSNQLTCNTAGQNYYKQVDGYQYNIGICPNTSWLMDPVADVKPQLDTFFKNLDGNSSASANYFVAAITPLTATSIQAMQNTRNADDVYVSTYSQALRMQAVDQGTRYIALANAVGNGSTSIDLNQADYSGVMTSIGNEIVIQKGTFVLQYPPTNQQQMIVSVVHADGSSTVINSSLYTISGSTLTITDLNTILSFKSTDSINVNYQPLTSIAT